MLLLLLQVDATNTNWLCVAVVPLLSRVSQLQLEVWFRRYEEGPAITLLLAFLFQLLHFLLFLTSPECLFSSHIEFLSPVAPQSRSKWLP